MKVIKIKNTRSKTESVQIISVELYDASDLRDWAYEHAWSGARDRLEDLDKYAGGWEILFDLIEQDAWQNASGTVTDTYINDTIWFVDEILDDFNSVYEDTLEESKTLRENTNEEMKIRTFLVNALEELQTRDVEATSLKLRGGYSLFVMGDNTIGNPEDKVLLVEIIYKGEYVDHDLVMTKDDIDLILELLDTARANQALHENKTLKENKTELNEDYVLGIEEQYDTNWEFEIFILQNDFIVAHGSDNRDAMYPLYGKYEVLTDLLREHGIDEDSFGTLTEVEEMVEELGYHITTFTGYSQGDSYTIVTKEPVKNFGHLEDIIFGRNHYIARLYKIGRGRLIQVDSVQGFHIPKPTVEDIHNIVQYFDVIPAYYKLNINSSYTVSDFSLALDTAGLKDFDTLEESKKIKSRVNLVESKDNFNDNVTAKQYNKIKEAILNTYWDSVIMDDGIEFETWSPAGENLIEFLDTRDGLESGIESLVSYLYDFDEEDHIEMWIRARAEGAKGVPSIKELVNDAEEIKDILYNLAGILESLNLEESKKIKSRVNLTEGAFDELSFNYKEDLAALYSVANFMDYEEYNEEFGTKYRSKRAYERGLYQDLLHIIDGAKASGDLSETDVYNVDDILNANAEFIDILAGILTYFNI